MPLCSYADGGVVDNGNFGEGVALCKVGKIDDSRNYAFSAISVGMPRVAKDDANRLDVLVLKRAIFNRFHES